MKLLIKLDEIKKIVAEKLSESNLTHTVKPEELQANFHTSGSYDNQTLEFIGFEVDLGDIDLWKK